MTSSTAAVKYAMHEPTKTLGRSVTRLQSGPAKACIANSTSGTSNRYRFSSPITRQAKSLGVTDGAAALTDGSGKWLAGRWIGGWRL